MSVKIKYIGHSAVFVEINDSGVLIDPFITGNPKSNCDFDMEKISDILVTHGHADHLGDAIPISRKMGVPITAIFELANYCSEKGAMTKPINMGGKIEYSWGSARFMPAFHSSSTPEGNYAGMPASIFLDINGTKIYHAGDSCLHSEFKTVGEVYKPDVVLIPIGSVYTMDTEEALVAAEWLNAEVVIPIHYNTFDAIHVDVFDFKEKIEALGKKCVVLNPGEIYEV